MMRSLYASALYLATFCLFEHQSAGNQSASPASGPVYHGLAGEARSTGGGPSAISDFALSSETPEASDFANRDRNDEPLGKALADKSAFPQALTPEGWRLAEPGYEFRFPQDHGPHPDYRTEWWYLTGNLQTADGKEFGYELTFFRYGYRSPGQRTPVKSRFVIDDVKFAHFTVTDVRAKSFHVAERTSRGAYGDAGFLSGSRLAWIGDWELDLGQQFEAKAENAGCAIDLELDPAKSPVLEGENGYSRKASTGDHASEYYSITRMRTQGSVVIAGQTFQVSGLSWFDREWSTNQLAPNQAGWNWFGIQLDDGSDLMLYQIRLRDGAIDPCSSGKWIDRDGHTVDIANGEFVLQPTRFWTTADKHATYPIGWRLKIEKLGLDAEISTPVENQELNVGVRYWEGCVRIKGTRDQQGVTGKGYLELTGFTDSPEARPYGQ